MSTRHAAALIVIAACAWAALAAAEPPTSDGLAADALHRTAVAAAHADDWPAAIAAWEAAAKAAPHWKYKLNLASAYAHSKQWLPAFEALGRARTLGLPEKYAERAALLETRITEKLRLDHAWIEVSVHPPGAAISSNGQPMTFLEAGRWVPGAQTSIEAAAQGHQTVRRTLDHPVGGRYSYTLTLELEPKPLPKPAAVARPAPAPARAAITIEKQSGFSSTLTWAVLGSGVAVAVSGAAVLGWSQSLLSDIEDLNRTAADYDAYSPEYDSLASQHTAAEIAGAVLLSAGAAAAVTGAVLLVLDGSNPTEASPATSVSPALLNGGGGLSATVRF